MAVKKTKEMPEEVVENSSEKKDLNEIFSELDTLISGMEQEESLEKVFDTYKKGVELLKTATTSIDKIEKQVKVLDEEGTLS